jgi:hypothetical protein
MRSSRPFSAGKTRVASRDQHLDPFFKAFRFKMATRNFGVLFTSLDLV